MELSDALGISDRAVFSLLAQMDESFSIYSERDPDNKRCVRYKAKSSDPNLKATTCRTIGFRENLSEIFGRISGCRFFRQ